MREKRRVRLEAELNKLKTRIGMDMRASRKRSTAERRVGRLSQKCSRAARFFNVEISDINGPKHKSGKRLCISIERKDEHREWAQRSDGVSGHASGLVFNCALGALKRTWGSGVGIRLSLWRVVGAHGLCPGKRALLLRPAGCTRAGWWERGWPSMSLSRAPGPGTFPETRGIWLAGSAFTVEI